MPACGRRVPGLINYVSVLYRVYIKFLFIGRNPCKIGEILVRTSLRRSLHKYFLRVGAVLLSEVSVSHTPLKLARDPCKLGGLL